MKNIFTTLGLLLILNVALTAQTLTDSLIAYYPFNGNANDASGNGNNGTAFGATLTNDRFGNANSAYAFNGSSDYISNTANQNFKPTTFPFAVTAWIKSNNGSINTGPIFKNDHEPNQYTGIIFQVNPGGFLHVYYGDGGTTGGAFRRSKIGTINIDDNQWHFVAGVIRGPNDMDLYVDCHYDSMANYSGGGGDIAYSTNNGVTGMVDVVEGTFYYDGSLDDIRLYHRNLTQTDLQQLYSYPAPYDDLSLDLGTDTSICVGETLTLNPDITGTVLSYNWSTGSTASSITINSPGTYVLSINNTCSYDFDTINVTLCVGEDVLKYTNTIELLYLSENNSVKISGLGSLHNATINIELFNALGQKITTESIHQPDASVTYQLPKELTSGLYFINVSSVDVHKTLKFVKD